MPSRPAIIAIVLLWLATMGWLAYRVAYPRYFLQSDEPTFIVDLADEVAPQYCAFSYLNNQAASGKAATVIRPQKDGHFEASTRSHDIDLLTNNQVNFKLVSAVVSHSFDTTGQTRGGSSRGKLVGKLLGMPFEIEFTTKTERDGDSLRSTAEITYLGQKTNHPLTTVELVSLSTFSVFEPAVKFSPLRPGQTWKVSVWDPTSQAISIAMRTVTEKLLADSLGGKWPLTLPETPPPSYLVAKVASAQETIEVNKIEYRCWLIEYERDDFRAKTWVDVEDGKVIKHEFPMLNRAIIGTRN